MNSPLSSTVLLFPLHTFCNTKTLPHDSPNSTLSLNFNWNINKPSLFSNAEFQWQIQSSSKAMAQSAVFQQRAWTLNLHLEQSHSRQSKQRHSYTQAHGTTSLSWSRDPTRHHFLHLTDLLKLYCLIQCSSVLTFLLYCTCSAISTALKKQQCWVQSSDQDKFYLNHKRLKETCVGLRDFMLRLESCQLGPFLAQLCESSTLFIGTIILK